MHSAMFLSLEAQRFSDKWITAIGYQLRLLKKQVPASVNSWEGRDAVRELKEADNLCWVLPTGTTEPLVHQLFKKLTNEISIYKRFRDDIVPANRSFELAIKAVTRAALPIKKALPRTSALPKTRASREVIGILNRGSTALESALGTLQEKQRSYWETTLLALPEERERWPIALNKSQGKVEVQQIPPADIAQLEPIFEGARYRRQLQKRIDYDRRLQIRIALILRSYLPLRFEPTFYGTVKIQPIGTSLRTISRLTALAYRAAELGHEKDDGLIVDGTKRRLTVAGIDQKLRDVRLR